MSGTVKQERVQKEPPNDVFSSKVKRWLDSLGALEINYTSEWSLLEISSLPFLL